MPKLEEGEIRIRDLFRQRFWIMRQVEELQTKYRQGIQNMLMAQKIYFLLAVVLAILVFAQILVLVFSVAMLNLKVHHIEEVLQRIQLESPKTSTKSHFESSVDEDDIEVPDVTSIHWEKVLRLSHIFHPQSQNYHNDTRVQMPLCAHPIYTADLTQTLRADDLLFSAVHHSEYRADLQNYT